MPFEKKWDWEAIRLDYMIGQTIINKDGLQVQRPYTIKSLAEKHNIPEATVQSKSKKEKWVAQRNLLDSKLRRRLNEGKVTALLGESTMSDSLALSQLSKATQMITNYFKQYNLDENSDISYNEKETPPINPRELKDVVGVIKEIHLLTKSIIGTDSLQEHLEEIQVKDKAKQLNKLKTDPKAMEDKLQQLLKRRQELISSNNAEYLSLPANQQTIEVEAE
jgi:hypothetical protein